MTKRALWLFVATGMTVTVVLAGLLIYSIRAGIASVTIPIFALVLGPALAATALVATCSLVAPPLQPQPILRAVEIRSASIDAPVESVS